MDKNKFRWRQRFETFEQAFMRLKEAVELPKLNELERNGMIQRFEFTFELAWKTLKDFLQYKAFNFKPSPKDTIRSIISDFEESTLPYFVDVINFPELQHAGLKEHIKKVGKLFYSRDTVSVFHENKAHYKR